MNLERSIAMEKTGANLLLGFDGAARVVEELLGNRNIGQDTVETFDTVLANFIRIRAVTRGKNRLNGIVVQLRERVIFVIVAAGATQSEPHKGRAGGVRG